MEPPTERLVEAGDGVRLWTRRSGAPGSGTTILCCHGGPGSADYMQPLEDLLATSCSLVRWDQRGSGRSDVDGPWSLDRFVADLEAVRRTWALDRPVVLGHSWGAGLALLHAQAHPGRVAGLVYVAGTGLEWWPRFSALHKERQLERLGAGRGARLAELRRRARTPGEDHEFRTLYVRSELHDPDDDTLVESVLAHEREFPPNPAVNTAISLELRQVPLADQLAACARVTCPALVIHGASDPRPIEALDSLVAALPDCEMVVLDGAGHTPWLDDPPGFAAVVHRFLARVTAQPS